LYFLKKNIAIPLDIYIKCVYNTNIPNYFKEEIS